MLLFPRMTQLDLTRPHEVLLRAEELIPHLVWKNRDSVTDSSGLRRTNNQEKRQTRRAGGILVDWDTSASLARR
jgi:hypothetical protein